MHDRVEFSLNGKAAGVVADPQRPLLDVLREDFRLTGTKYGCGEEECGACTVLVDGTAVRSCLVAVSEARGRRVETIEGLASPDGLHGVQRAFLELQAMQCGYCVPGHIMSVVGLIRRSARSSATRTLAPTTEERPAAATIP